MATKITITKTLEARLRKGAHNHEDAKALVDEIVRLLDETTKRAAGSTPGLGYKELVALFRFALGPDLVVPMSPSTGYIVRMVNRAKDLGIVKENVEQIVRGLRAGYRPPYSLEFVISRADHHYSRGDGDRQGSGEGNDGHDMDERDGGLRVYVGRPDFDD